MKTRFGRVPLIVGCIGTAAGLRRCARQPPARGDILEVRLDLTGTCQGDWMRLCAAIQARGRPVLLTIRDESEGGHWTGREAERLALYLKGLKSVSAVDIELRVHALEILLPAAHRCGVKVVGSFHDFHGTPDSARLNEIVKRGRRLGVDIVKIATMVKSPRDLARLFALPAHAEGPVSVMGMGVRGMVTRVALPGAGSCLVYGTLDKPTAPGQVSVRLLARELVRWGVRQA